MWPTKNKTSTRGLTRALAEYFPAVETIEWERPTVNENKK